MEIIDTFIALACYDYERAAKLVLKADFSEAEMKYAEDKLRTASTENQTSLADLPTDRKERLSLLAKMVDSFFEKYKYEKLSILRLITAKKYTKSDSAHELLNAFDNGCEFTKALIRPLIINSNYRLHASTFFDGLSGRPAVREICREILHSDKFLTSTNVEYLLTQATRPGELCQPRIQMAREILSKITSDQTSARALLSLEQNEQFYIDAVTLRLRLFPESFTEDELERMSLDDSRGSIVKKLAGKALRRVFPLDEVVDLERQITSYYGLQ